jgi:hypothetical protein
MQRDLQPLRDAHAALVELRRHAVERVEVVGAARAAFRDDRVAKLRQLAVEHARERGRDFGADLVIERDRAIRLLRRRERQRGDDAVGELLRLRVSRPGVGEVVRPAQVVDERVPQIGVLGERQPIIDVERRKRLGEIAQHAVETPPGAQVVEPGEQIACERLGLEASSPGVDQARAELVQRSESLLWKCDGGHRAS